MRGGAQPQPLPIPKMTAPIEVEEQVIVAKLPPPGVVPAQDAVEETEAVTQKIVAQPLVQQPVLLPHPMQPFPGMPRPGMPRPGMPMAPTRLPAPPAKPIITPQQARLGTIAAALGAGLLFF